MTIWHIHMTIAAAEQQADRKLESLFSGEAHEIRASLAVMKAKGMEVIPSAGCDNQDAKGYCLGHQEQAKRMKGGVV